jgi:imidazolonepropionase-like amidohydrolase/ABC-type multidrug transport system permease subunit
MNTTRACLALIRALALESLRSKAALFWTLLFPLFFLLLFGGVMARGNTRAATSLMPGLYTNMLLASTIFAVGARLVSDRESGVLRRLSVAPVSAFTVVLAHGLAALATQLVSFGLLFAAARAFFGVRVAGSPVLFALAWLAGGLALLPLGLLIGSVARDSRSAPALSNLLFFPMLFLSGATFPFAFLPDWLQDAARVLPATWVVDALNATMVRGEGLPALAPSLAVLLALSVAGLALNARLFRWEGTDALPRRLVALVTLGFVLTVGVVAAFGPALRLERTLVSRAAAPGQARGQVRVLRGATLIDGMGGRVPNARVTLRDHRVAEIAPDGPEPLPAGATVDDWSGRYLVPGLIDSHAHLGGSGGVGASPQEHAPERQVRDLQALLALGVTSVLSLTDDPRDLLALRGQVARGEMRAPRVFLAGPSLTAPGGHPTELFAFAPALALRLTRQVATEADARETVDELARRGVDALKLVLDSGGEDEPLPRLDEAVFRAAVVEARRLGLRTTVHVGDDRDARLAADAGADGLEHVPADLSDETIGRLVARRTTLTPTLVIHDAEWKRRVIDGREPLSRAWADPETLASLGRPGSVLRRVLEDGAGREGEGRNLRRCADATARAARAGVTILAGSDSGAAAVFHGPGLHRELELLVEAALLSPTDALAAATRRAADRLGQAELGRIAVGAVADLLVVGADPTVDIRALHDVRGVYLGGLPQDRERLLSSPAGPWLPGRN